MRISNFAMWIIVIAFTGLVACSDDGGGNTADGPPAVELTCASYCTRITTNCTATNQQFGQMSECMATCTRYPLGAATDMMGDTLGCRLYHAGAAMVDPAVHCRHAGPGGDGACGANCLGFCTLTLAACTGSNAQYGGDMTTCMTACGGYATTPPYNSMQTAGDTFACRLYHATVATLNPAVHCAHTAAVSATCKP